MTSLPEPKMEEDDKHARLRELLICIVSAICKNTPTPVIGHIPTEATFTLCVNPSDQGRCVGKKGSVIWAIQTIMWYAGLAQLKAFYTVKLLDPKTQWKGPSMPFKFNKKWDRKKVENICYKIIEACLPLHSDCKMKEIDDTTALVSLRIEKYLQTPLSDPNFVGAFETIVHAVGMSNGATIKTEATFE